MAIVVHHNPGCGTSQKMIQIIKEAGQEPEVIEYLETRWTRLQLLALFAAADLTPKSASRTSNSPAEELGLLADDVADEAIFEAMLEYPVLVNRPIVCSPKGVKLCRPAETVHDLL